MCGLISFKIELRELSPGRSREGVGGALVFLVGFFWVEGGDWVCWLSLVSLPLGTGAGYGTRGTRRGPSSGPAGRLLPRGEVQRGWACFSGFRWGFGDPHPALRADCSLGRSAEGGDGRGGWHRPKYARRFRGGCDCEDPHPASGRLLPRGEVPREWSAMGAGSSPEMIVGFVGGCAAERPSSGPFGPTSPSGRSAEGEV